MGSSSDILIRDFSHTLPVDAVTKVDEGPRKGRWRLLRWESRTDAGTCLFAYTEQTPNVVVPLPQEGHYAISLGLFAPAIMRGGIRVRLTGDGAYDLLKVVKPFRWIPVGAEAYRFEEHFWRLADLTGRDLHIESTDQGTGLAFIRLIPLSSEQVEKLRTPRTVPWMTTIDGHGVFLPYSMATGELLDADALSHEPQRMVTDNIESFADSDFTALSWGAIGADLVNYETNVGLRFNTLNEPAVRALDTQISTNVERLIRAGYHTPKLAVDTCRRRGMKILLAQRPQAFVLEPPLDTTASEFYRDHVHCRCMTREGRRTVQLSFAYPEVRRHLIHVLLEMADCKPDGLHLIFNRGIPCTLYERRVLGEFREEYGLDMGSLAPEDSRVITFRYRYITAFLTELREAVGPDMEIAVSCFSTRGLNDRFGLDVHGWAESGIVTMLCPFQWEWQQDDYDMAMFSRIAEATDRDVWPFAYNGNLHRGCLPHQHRHRALELIRAGAKGLCGWDTPGYLSALKLGHVNELEIWDDIAEPLPQTDIVAFNDVSVEPVANPHYTA